MKREVANKLSSLRREELRKDAELQSNTSLRLKTMLKVSQFLCCWFYYFDLHWFWNDF